MVRLQRNKHRTLLGAEVAVKKGMVAESQVKMTALEQDLVLVDWAMVPVEKD